MKKIAFFVEGPTEGDFIIKLLKEYTNEKCFVKTFIGQGGKKTPRVFIYKYSNIEKNKEYEVHIFISTADNRVNSDVRDHIDSLRIAGFSNIVALKDLRGDKQPNVPRTLADLPIVEHIEKLMFSSANPPVSSVIAVMEIETWFIAETNHYVSIDSGLNRSLIESNAAIIGANPYTDDLTQVAMPAEMLDKIYQLRGKHYGKSETTRKKTIDSLDYANLYVNVPSRLVKLQEFFNILDSIFV